MTTDRTLGMTIIGQTGFGKTAFLHNLIIEDIREGRNSIVIDPHGDLSTDLLESIDSKYSREVYVLEVSEAMPFGLNLYECENRTSQLAIDRVVDNSILVFKRLMQSERDFHPHIEYLLRNTGYTILDNPPLTMAEMSLMFAQSEQGKTFRSNLLKKIDDVDLYNFWHGVEERRGNLAYQYIEPLLNKVSPFTASRVMRLIVGQEHTTIPFSEFLDQPGKTLIVNLPIGVLGEEKTQMLGMTFLSLLSEQIYERVNQRKASRVPVHLYIDEAGLFFSSGTAISKLLKQGRKFGCATHLSFQTLSDLPDREAQSAVLQTGTLVFFQVIGGTDAEILSKQLQVKQPPVEQVPRMRMEPNIKEWDEEIWTDEKAEWEHEHPYWALDAFLAQKREELANLYTIDNCFKQVFHYGMGHDFYDLARDDAGKFIFFRVSPEEYQEPFIPSSHGKKPIETILERCCDELQNSEAKQLVNGANHRASKLLEDGDYTNRQEVIRQLKSLSMFLSVCSARQAEPVMRMVAKQQIEKQERCQEEGRKLVDEFWEQQSEKQKTYFKKIHHVEQDGWIPVKTEEVRVPTQIENYSRRGPAYFQGSSVLQREQQIYDMVDGTPRPFSDLWNELQAILANLPPYYYYMQTINENKEIIESQQKSAAPPQAQDYGQEQAEEIRVRSLTQFGRPAEVVRKNLTDRVAPFLNQPEKPEPEVPPEDNQPRQQRSRTKRLEI